MPNEVILCKLMITHSVWDSQNNQQNIISTAIPCPTWSWLHAVEDN